MKTALTFDDVQIVPRYSELKSREKVNLDSKFTPNTTLSLPLVASPMDTVTEINMAKEMLDQGGVGVIHRFQSIEKQTRMMKSLHYEWDRWYNIGGDKDRTDHTQVFEDWYERLSHWNHPPTKSDYEDLHESLWFADEAQKDEDYWSRRPLCAAVGVTGDYLERAQELVNNGCNVLLIDVAHGHHKLVKDALRRIKNETGTVEVVVGSIATKESARDCIEWGADALRVGIGNGSLCETRIRTGVGIPQVTAITDVCSVADHHSIPIIADGGCRYVGDVAKSLALGASSVMVGSLFAGTKETPGEIIKQGEWPNERLYKKYRGSASLDSKSDRREYGNVEGNSKIIEYKGKVYRIISDIRDGVRSAFSYVGAGDVLDFQAKAKIIQITESGRIEARPHLL